MAFPSYATGTVAVGAADTVIIGNGTVWSGVNARAGDDIVIAGHIVIVEDVTDPTHLVIDPWPFDAVAPGTTYKIVQRSPLRFAGGQAMADVSALVGVLNGTGTIYAVTGAEPDPSLGSEGQYALKTNTGIWKLWLKTGGEWVDQGSPVGTNYRSTWNAATNYAANDVVVRLGSGYIAKGPTINQPPESNPAAWDLLAQAGTNGATWSSGTSVPTGGNVGDYYLRTSTDDIYKNVAGTWTIIVNIKGDKGDKGDTGTPGAAATIAVGSVTTLPAGSSATVTNTGSAGAASLAFGIPRGDTGVQGLQGPQGLGVQPDATGSLAQRTTYDGQTQGFKFLQTDVSPFRLFVKASNTSADWAGPNFIGGSAAVGDLGSVADTVLQTYDYGVAA
jgi:hypothetical protein